MSHNETEGRPGTVGTVGGLVRIYNAKLSTHQFWAPAILPWSHIQGAWKWLIPTGIFGAILGSIGSYRTYRSIGTIGTLAYTLTEGSYNIYKEG